MYKQCFRIQSSERLDFSGSFPHLRSAVALFPFPPWPTGSSWGLALRLPFSPWDPDFLFSPRHTCIYPLTYLPRLARSCSSTPFISGRQLWSDPSTWLTTKTTLSTDHCYHPNLRWGKGGALAIWDPVLSNRQKSLTGCFHSFPTNRQRQDIVIYCIPGFMLQLPYSSRQTKPWRY